MSLALIALLAAAHAAAVSPWIEKEASFEIAGVFLPARITLPAATAPTSAILLVPGSLFSDVDGNYPVWGLHPNIYADLARQLATRGHAVLRFAKIGPGTGSETRDAEAALAHRRFLTRVEVAAAALARLHEHSGRDLPTIVAGHSEGAVVASLLAARTAVAGVASLSGPSTGLFDIMREQLQLPPGSPSHAYASFDAVVTALRAGEGLPATAAADPTTAMFANLDAVGLAYITEVDAVDPTEALAGLDVPVLILQGGRDFSVGSHHAERLAAARASRPTEVVILEELQHFYKRVEEGADPRASFALETETDRSVAETLDLWIRSGLRETPGG